MSKQFVHYGCGLCAPEGWVNFDASPTLRFERLPIVGRLYTRNSERFPDSVRVGDITKGLPGIAPQSCDGVYSSHVLEHLSLGDARAALKNTLAILKPGGIFRIVVPDLEAYVREYLVALEDPETRHKAAETFISTTHLGRESRPRSLSAMARSMLGNSAHLWMFDGPGLAAELENTGFTDIRPARCGDSEEPAFSAVENPGRFERSVAFQARRPQA